MDSDWVNRAGILAEAASFFLIAPEVFGPQRLKAAEEALRKGLANPAIEIGANLAWAALVAVAYFGMSLAVVLALFVPLPLALGVDLYAWNAFTVTAAVAGAVGPTVSMLADFRCRLAVRPFISKEEGHKGELFIVRRGYALTNLMILNPFNFARVGPSRFVWFCWFLGLPAQLFDFVAYSILPAIPVALVRMQQRLLAGHNALRGLVFGPGVLLLFGGLVAQFFATF